MDTEDGKVFIKHLAYFVRTHEKALANALQLQRKHTKNASTSSTTAASVVSGQQPPSTSTNALAAALSLPYLTFGSQNVKPVKLTLTPHHLFYLLSRFEELAISVGPMNVRLENINTDVLPGNYVSFLGSAPKSRGRSDADSIHSVSSVRSALSTMSSMWTKLGLTSKEDSKIEKQKAVEKDDLKYLYSAFTKIPCLRLAPDHRSRLIAGYEEFPFDTAVPLFAFKNLSALEICDLDFRQMYGWDRLAEQLRSLTIKRGSVDDVTDLLVHIVLDDMDKRRRRSSKHPIPSSPATPWPAPSPSAKHVELPSQFSTPTSPLNENRRASLGSPGSVAMARKNSTEGKKPIRHHRQRSQSPVRPPSSRQTTASHMYPRTATPKYRRSSGSDSSSVHSTPRNSSSNLLSLGTLQPSKWRFLKHLSLADNGMTFILAAGLAPLATTLHSLDLSSNLFTEIPDSLATLTNLRALNLSNCMISSLHSLGRNPLPAITVINLHSNRLSSLAGIERLFSLEKIDLRDNRLTDPTELARLTRIPDMQHVYVHRNPFTRTHSNYRTTIFNLFRSSVGYTEDICIDSTGPSYGEKKYLVDRIVEENGTPVVRKPDDISMPPPAKVPQKLPKIQSAEVPKESSAYDTAQRRKAPRRRIVELSQSNPSSPEARRVDTPNAEPDSPTKTISEPRPSIPSQGKQSAPLLPPIETRALPPSPSHTTPDLVEDEDSPIREPDEINMASDVYRQKIEALKNDLGSGWLTALNEDKWDQRRPAHRSHGSDYSSVHSGRSGIPSSKGVAVSARTLG
ncbi:hypothetical protein CAC42_1301 [Sphaceloma murrayae]|uniref:Leucine-rich repeat-containing protein n=1 Tax=Sphaceloma murrayae TaxID=2082308 RepID=A0A2K1R2K8_9PEZI|nr:hypothetical protein CAC42_1301 [Sphaceloma murrayae]